MGFTSARKKAGMSQSDVAKELGIAPAAVCQWETGKTRPRAKLLPKIAALLNCSIEELLAPDEEPASEISQ